MWEGLERTKPDLSKKICTHPTVLLTYRISLDLALSMLRPLDRQIWTLQLLFGIVTVCRYSCPMFQYIALAEEREWQTGPYEGVELKPLHKDDATGRMVVMRRFKAGLTVPAHIHPDANEWAYILSGEWEESGKIYGAGTLFHAPKGAAHGPHVAKTDVVSLTIFDGPLTVVDA
ncbi:MAG: quercetin dioxygenase-like cupin family protein [Limisphaerales bacterium]|jgi:quercetin dioxygenase-like cupin family protein